MKYLWCLFILTYIKTNAGDTLYTHPFYPPLIYEGDEYNFYKYTPKYIPKDLLHCFKILGTTDSKTLDRFKLRSTDEVIERGIFDRGYRLRKEFCLDGYSPFSLYFLERGIYFPHAMQTYILLSFHQYLNGEYIRWHQNKNLALKDLGRENREWRKRSKKLFRSRQPKEELQDNETNFSEEEIFEQQFFGY